MTRTDDAVGGTALATLSFWMDDAATRGLVPDPAPPCTSGFDTDVLVVGGGFSGLSAAIELARAGDGRRVSLIEAQRVGFGASGRNAGIVSPIMSPLWFVPGSLARGEAAWATVELQGRVRRVIDGLSGLDAGARSASLHIAAPYRPVLQGLRWFGEQLAAAGFDVELLDAEQAFAATGERCRGSLVVAAHTIHPARLALARRAEAAAAGVEVFEHTPLDRLEPATGAVTAWTAAGVPIRAARVVLATGGWPNGVHAGRKGPVLTWMFATPVLAPDAIEALGGDRAAVGTIRLGLTYRRTYDGRLLLGGLDHRQAAPDPPGFVPERTVQRLRRLLRASLPQLGEVEIEAVWGGPMQPAGDELPRVVRAPHDERITLIERLGGSGVMWAHVAGRLARGLVDRSLDTPEDHRLRRAMASTRIPFGRMAALALRFGLHPLSARNEIP